MKPRFPSRALPALLLLLLAVRLAVAARADSSVADEHPHILSGLLYWTSGRFSGGLDNPPLGQLVIAAPVAFLHLPYRFPADDLLFWCRAPVMLATLLLAIVLARWAQQLGGLAAACVVLAALSFEPNLIAHGHLATLDLPVTLLWWVALWSWRRYLRLEAGVQTGSRQLRALWVAAFALGAAAAFYTKFTGILLLPAAWFVALLVLPDRGARWRASLAILASGVVLWLAAYPVYGFEGLRAGLPQHLLDGLHGKFAHRAEVQFAYLAGRRSEGGFLAYYLIAVLVKTPLPLLALASVGAIQLARHARRELVQLVLPAALLVATFSAIRVDIGVRHVLALYPALVLLAAVGVVAAWRCGKRAQAGVVVALLLWFAGVARLGSESLTYFNCVAGGPAHGDRWLLDSNLDWGQDDARLTRFLKQAAQRSEEWEIPPTPEQAHAGRLAVNANALHNLQRRAAGPYDWLVEIPPTAFCGGAWRLYRLDVGLFARRAGGRDATLLACVAYAEALDADGQQARAEETFAAAARRFDFAPRVVCSAARAAARRGDLAAALNWVGQGRRLHPEAVELQRLQHGFDLARRLALAVGGDPQSEGHAAFELGLWRAQLGEVVAGADLLRRAAELLPDDLDAQGAYAVALVHRGEFDAALRVLERVAPQLPEQRDLCAALARTERAVRTAAGPGAPDLDIELLHELGRAHFDDERYDDAARVFVEALRLRPDDALALAYLCEMQVRSKLRITAERLAPRALTP